MSRAASDAGTGVEEGYVYCSYGGEEYLHHAVASLVTLRRHDNRRPVALATTPGHLAVLNRTGAGRLFDRIVPLGGEHCSITGFKHNLHHYQLFRRTLFLDSDMICCRDPDPLWKNFSSHTFTITGNRNADIFFGAAKDIRVVADLLLMRRRRTLRRFGLSFLSRVQSGMIYSSDPATTRRVCRQASIYLDRREETHFRSRLEEKGRSLESCEWSLAMAMSAMGLPVFPWYRGGESPQLDYVADFTGHDELFNEVHCLYYTDRRVYDLRGIRNRTLRNLLIALFCLIPGKGERFRVTPYLLHFGWKDEKEPFRRFSSRIWKEVTGNRVDRASGPLSPS